MKTAISVPDDTYRKVEAAVHELGWNRSEFFTKAAESYLNLLEASSLERRVAQALELIDPADLRDEDVEAVGLETLENSEW